MVGEKRFLNTGWGWILTSVWLILIVLNGSLFADEQNTASKLERYRVFALKHISAEQGIKYLADAAIDCTVSQLPVSDTLLATGQPIELRKAAAILRVVDCNEQFVVRTLLPASEANSLPSNEQIAAKLGEDISIGTFADPPSITTKHRAIIDLQNDSVMAITTAEQFERIVFAVEQLQKSQQPAEAAAPAEPAGAVIQPKEPNAVAQAPQEQTKPVPESGERIKAESDELFRILTEAQKAITEAQTQLDKIGPNEPNAVPAAPATKVEQLPAVSEAAPQTQQEAPKPTPEAERAAEPTPVAETEEAAAEPAEPVSKAKG